MRQQVLKALANPARIFYVPYSLAVINFALQFGIYVAIFVFVLITTGKSVDTLYFVGSLCLVHMILASFSKKEPQMGQIIAAKINLFKYKIPRRLIA